MPGWILIAGTLVGLFTGFGVWRNRQQISWYTSLPGMLFLGSSVYFSAFAVVNLGLSFVQEMTEAANWHAAFATVGGGMTVLCLLLFGVWGFLFRKRILLPQMLKEAVAFAGVVTVTLIVTANFPSLNWW